MKRGLISFLASTSLKGEGELDLFSGLDIARGRGGLICSSGVSTSLEGEEDLSHLYWVSTLEERPAERKVVSSSACLNTWDKVTLWCPRPWRGLLQQCRIVHKVSKHQGNLALIPARSVPTPEKGLPWGSAVSFSRCLKTPRCVLGAHAQGKAC